MAILIFIVRYLSAIQLFNGTYIYRLRTNLKNSVHAGYTVAAATSISF